MENVSIIAQLKKSKKPGDKTATIIYRGYYNSQPVASNSSGYKVLIDHWDEKARQLVSTAPNARLINMAIDLKLQDMQKLLLQKEIMGATITKQHVIRVVKGNDNTKDFIEFARAKINANYKNPDTRRQYHGELTKMLKYFSPITFGDIDYEFLEGYRNYMRDDLGNSDNTIWKSFKFLHRMLELALKTKGIIKENPMADFDRGKYVQPDRDWLEIEECERILDKVINNEDQPIILRRVAIYFLLMCYSGLRFEDAMKFDPQQHIIEDNHLQTITSKGKGKLVHIKLYNRLDVIVKLIKVNPIEKMDNRTFNDWLKIVGTMAGIQLPLSAHIGRHTFGGFLADAEIPLEQAQHLLGHHDIDATKIYYHMKKKKLEQAATKLNYL